MESKSIHMRISEKGSFSVFELFQDGDQLIIALPHRTSITLQRIHKVIKMDCDLGLMPSDFCPIGIINTLKTSYRSAIILDPEFIKRTNSFEESFFPKKFVTERSRLLKKASKILSPGHVFGNQWQDQVFIHLAPREEKLINIEFGIFRSDTLDDEPLKEPAYTLCSSLRIGGQILPHYWFFVEWSGNELWNYTNFSYNNKVFLPKKTPKGVVAHAF